MKTLQGLVVSIKMQNTVVVEIVSQLKHPLYKKIIFRSKRLKVDNNQIKVNEGDQVLIGGTRPISKTKHYKIIKIIKKSI